MRDNLATLSATQLLPRLLSGGLSVETLARSCLERITARDPEVHAWAYLDHELVIAQARMLDHCGVKGPLHGLPIGIKDVILTRDMPTQYNSPIYEGFHPNVDAACVTVLRNAGALIFGKTATVEFAATGRKATTCNPHDLARTPGGSSSGSGAAVADGHVPLALGTQTGGSIIRPASYCGVYALKPTWNLVSREGAKAFSASLDTVGWFGRSAADLALLYGVFDRAEAPVFTVENSRIGLCRSPVWNKADAATRSALEAAAEILRRAGAHVIDLELPAPFENLADLQCLIMRYEASSAFLPEYRTNPNELHTSIREQVENIDGYTRSQLCTAYDVAAQCRATFDKIASGYDAVLTPSTVGEAPLGLASTGDFIFNCIWTLLHVPCVNVPGFSAVNGMPVGLTVTGPRFSDRRMVSVAAAFGELFKSAN